MTTPSPLSDQERAELIAFLDGELTGEAAREIENRLSRDPVWRAEAEALKQTWDLLDFLPRPEPSAHFTHRTLSLVQPSRPLAASRGRRWQPWAFGLGWAAALLVASVGGFAGYNFLVPREPSEQELIRDLRLIENKRLYEMVDDLDFLRHLDRPDLFGDEAQDS
jgi:anti-sigma factor RsiW